MNLILSCSYFILVVAAMEEAYSSTCPAGTMVALAATAIAVHRVEKGRAGRAALRNSPGACCDAFAAVGPLVAPEILLKTGSLAAADRRSPPDAIKRPQIAKESLISHFLRFPVSREASSPSSRGKAQQRYCTSIGCRLGLTGVYEPSGGRTPLTEVGENVSCG